MKRPKPMAGCGPYLMFEKEEKMSTLGNFAPQSDGSWSRQISGVQQQAQQRAMLLMQNDAERCALSRAYNAEHRVRELESHLAAISMQNSMLHNIVKERTDERDALRQRVSLPSERGNHDYHGPKGPDGKAAPDPVHERVHEVVGDILAGRVIDPARRQLQEALKQAPKDKAPFPIRASAPVLEKGVRI